MHRPLSFYFAIFLLTACVSQSRRGKTRTPQEPTQATSSMPEWGDAQRIAQRTKAAAALFLATGEKGQNPELESLAQSIDETDEQELAAIYEDKGTGDGINASKESLEEPVTASALSQGLMISGATVVGVSTLGYLFYQANSNSKLQKLRAKQSEIYNRVIVEDSKSGMKIGIPLAVNLVSKDLAQSESNPHKGLVYLVDDLEIEKIHGLSKKYLPWVVYLKVGENKVAIFTDTLKNAHAYHRQIPSEKPQRVNLEDLFLKDADLRKKSQPEIKQLHEQLKGALFHDEISELYFLKTQYSKKLEFIANNGFEAFDKLQADPKHQEIRHAFIATDYLGGPNYKAKAMKKLFPEFFEQGLLKETSSKRTLEISAPDLSQGKVHADFQKFLTNQNLQAGLMDEQYLEQLSRNDSYSQAFHSLYNRKPEKSDFDQILEYRKTQDLRAEPSLRAHIGAAALFTGASLIGLGVLVAGAVIAAQERKQSHALAASPNPAEKFLEDFDEIGTQLMLLHM